MRIRTKLTLTFALIVASILIISSLLINFFSADYRKQEFNRRLKDRAENTARILSKVDKVNSDLLRAIDQNTIRLPQEQIVIYNYLNQVIYNSSDEKPRFSTELINTIRLSELYPFKIGDKEAVGVLYTDKYNRFVVIASAIDIYGFRKLKNLQLVLLIVLFGSVLITIIAGYFYSVQFLKPISNVISQVEQITAQNLSVRVKTKNSKDEIAQLALTFNKMLARIEESFEMQKYFVANASHEFRTPLTSISGQIEVSLMKKRSEEEYKKTLNSILDDIRNLSKLSNGLLDLAQANQNLHIIGLSAVRIDEVLWQAREELLSSKPYCLIHIDFVHFPENEDALTIKSNFILLKTAFINLMENACKFSQKHEVWIKINFSDNLLVIEFKDEGTGIAKDEIEKIFEPFYRASTNKHIKGHGLGLVLTKRIILMHDGTIDISSELGKGTVVTVKFPNML